MKGLDRQHFPRNILDGGVCNHCHGIEGDLRIDTWNIHTYTHYDITLPPPFQIIHLLMIDI